MVDDSPTPKPHSSLPMAPRLDRSARLRNVLRSQPRAKQPASRAARSTRLRMKGNFFAFVAAQVLIGVVAFVVVTDYIADGPIKHQVSNILSPVADTGLDVKSDQDALIVVEPSTALDEASDQETTAIHEIPTAPEPVETPPAEIQKPAQRLSQRRRPMSKLTASITPSPTAEKAGEDVVALAPIPDLTPQADAPAATPPAESVKPKQADGQMIRDCATCPELVVINAGRFAMGEGSEGLEQQVSLTTTQEVTIAAPFAIGRYEITFDEWSQCVADGGCTSQPADENWGRGRRPVINVSFNDITQQYLPWLSRKTGFTYRLPTEAEWEFAARGGAAAAAGQAYSFGNDGTLLCQYGNSSERDRRQLQRRICQHGAGGLAETQCAWTFRHAWQCVGVDGRLLAAAIFRQSGEAGGDMRDARAARRLVGKQCRSAALRRPGLGEARTRARIPSDFAWRECCREHCSL